MKRRVRGRAWSWRSCSRGRRGRLLRMSLKRDAVREQVSEFRLRRQRRARAQRPALERGDGAARAQAALDLLAAQHAVDEARVEGVARAGRVVAAAGYGEGRRLDEDAAVVDDRAALAEGHPDDRVRAQPRLHLDERRVLVVY